MISSKVVTITPEMAASFLERNTRNRPVRKPVVTFLKNSILRGEWITTHQGIAFDEHGLLIDGQHRLLAIVAANTPIDAMVTWNISRAAFSVIDTVTPRKLPDLININQNCGQVVNLLSSICYYGNIASKITANQAQPIAKFIEPIHEKLFKTTFRGISTASIRSFVCYLTIATDTDDYSINLYNKLVTKSFKDLPIVGENFIKGVLRGNLHKKGKGQSNQLMSYGYADFVFNPKNKDKTRIIPRDGNEVIKEMQQNLRPFFIDDEMVNQENKDRVLIKPISEECRV
jgi:hypothetical protein